MYQRELTDKIAACQPDIAPACRGQHLREHGAHVARRELMSAPGTTASWRWLKTQQRRPTRFLVKITPAGLPVGSV